VLVYCCIATVAHPDVRSSGSEGGRQGQLLHCTVGHSHTRDDAEVDCDAQYGTLSQSPGTERRGMSEAQRRDGDGALGQSPTQHRGRAGGGNVPPVRASTQHTVRSVHPTVPASAIRVCAPSQCRRGALPVPPLFRFAQRQRNRAPSTRNNGRKEDTPGRTTNWAHASSDTRTGRASCMLVPPRKLLCVVRVAVGSVPCSWRVQRKWCGGCDCARPVRSSAALCYRRPVCCGAGPRRRHGFFVLKEAVRQLLSCFAGQCQLECHPSDSSARFTFFVACCSLCVRWMVGVGHGGRGTGCREQPCGAGQLYESPTRAEEGGRTRNCMRSTTRTGRKGRKRNALQRLQSSHECPRARRPVGARRHGVALELIG
jgi:hypothetical protein